MVDLTFPPLPGLAVDSRGDASRGPGMPVTEPTKDERTDTAQGGSSQNATPSSPSLQHGCYLATWSSEGALPFKYTGVVRVERRDDGVTASGDLYLHPEGGSGPNPKEGIPIFPRDEYRYYLRFTAVNTSTIPGNAFQMSFGRYRLNSDNRSWSFEGDYTAEMSFRNAPAQYAPETPYMEGNVTDAWLQVPAGNLTIGWVSKYLRKATVEIDRVGVSEFPGGSGTGVDWKVAFESSDWEVTAYESDNNIVEPSDGFWSDAEMHAKMLAKRDESDLDTTWRYYLLCVRRLDSTDRGIMFDAYAGDSNNVPREGAGISSHWVIPNTDMWGKVKGERFGASVAPYFRTAVHELGHAMGLLHNTADTGFMNTTGTIAWRSAGAFPDNVQWAFNSADKRRLRHLPDPYVRPGVIPFGRWPVPISPSDEMNRDTSGVQDMRNALQLEVEPLRKTVPIGAPVRVKVSLRNTSKVSRLVPASLSLKSNNVRGYVVAPGGNRRSFRNLMRCLDEHKCRVLESGETMSKDLTLLRGAQGALFDGPGFHEITVQAEWQADDKKYRLSGTGAVMIQPALTESHARAALKTLSTPDLLLTLVLGGDHLPAAMEALRVALDDETLAPHYAFVEAKRLAKRFQGREADLDKACSLITSEAVMSSSEVKRLAGILRAGKKGCSETAAVALRKLAAGDKEAEQLVGGL